MQQRKNKPWIKENWVSHGWDGKKKVWRLEFSFKSTTDGLMGVDEKTGEMLEMIHFKDINCIDKIKDIYDYHFNKYFKFVHYNSRKKRVDRMKPVVFFKCAKCEFVKIKLSNKTDSMRSDKVFLKKIIKLGAELRGHDFALGIFCNELMTYYIVNRDLRVWFSKKYPHIHLNEIQLLKGEKDMRTMFSQLSEDRRTVRDRLGNSIMSY